MPPSVKTTRNFGTTDRLEALRVQLMAGETAKRIGERIRQARLQAGFAKQRHLAERMREISREEGGPDVAVDGQRISDWERGVNKPNDRYMDLIAKATDHDVSWFWRGDMDTPDLSLADVRDEFRPDVDGVQDQLVQIATRLTKIEATLARFDADGEIEKQLKMQTGLLEDIQEVVAVLENVRGVVSAPAKAKARRDEATPETHPVPKAPKGRRPKLPKPKPARRIA